MDGRGTLGPEKNRCADHHVQPGFPRFWTVWRALRFPTGRKSVTCRAPGAMCRRTRFCLLPPRLVRDQCDAEDENRRIHGRADVRHGLDGNPAGLRLTRKARRLSTAPIRSKCVGTTGLESAIWKMRSSSSVCAHSLRGRGAYSGRRGGHRRLGRLVRMPRLTVNQEEARFYRRARAGIRARMTTTGKWSLS